MHTPEFTPGQRYVSEAEPELGIGILISHDKRSLNLHFPLGEATRCYSRASAPIQRVVHKPGDQVKTVEGVDFTVESVITEQGLLVYCGNGETVPETGLSMDMGFSLPQEKLMAGMGGNPRDFALRREILEARAKSQGMPCRGFLGGRLDLIPHQFYIAQEVCRRHAPRVMLSDETGLGKTIEACLIVHHLLVTHQISRVLIIVPDALVHQWFVELFRKFNLSFHIFNQETPCTDPDENPFLDAQHGIIAQSLLQGDTPHGAQILAAGWDLVIMDEAHHILDNTTFFRYMQALSRETQGLLLLSATPEQMGVEPHFAQLSLLDPDRYYDIDAYRAEAETYGETAKEVDTLLKKGEDPSLLLDTYGPGRVIFRNTRAAIKGFPGRIPHLIPLEATPGLLKQLVKEQEDSTSIKAGHLANDPRMDCLVELSKSIAPAKILVICSTKEKAAAVEAALESKIAIETTRFDETMSLMQRDRAAAWFAREDGARLLICSEIGSEGRNFQFVHHLFLFDLPQNPELLEQRIGRVDRIGQKNDIHIHVPHVKGSTQEILARWYHEGVDLFSHNVNGLHAVFSAFGNTITAMTERVAKGEAIPKKELDTLVGSTKDHCRKLDKKLGQGKNRLLELNSYKAAPAMALIEEVRNQDDAPGLRDLMTQLFDHYLFSLEPVDDSLYSLTAETTPDDAFPALPRDARFCTFDRGAAIAREDIAFFNWDHPFVAQVMDFFLTHGTGDCAVARMDGEPGLIMEAIFLVEAQGGRDLNVDRFLPATPVRIVVDHLGRNLSQAFDPEEMESRLEPDNPSWVKEMFEVTRELVPDLLDKCKSLAQTQAKSMKDGAINEMEQTLGTELKRLAALKEKNPNIRDEEIQSLAGNWQALKEAMDQADLRLDSLRLIRCE